MKKQYKITHQKSGGIETQRCEGASTPEWVSLKHRKRPQLEIEAGEERRSRDVLLLCDDGSMEIGYYASSDGVNYYWISTTLQAITHWMDLPVPPA